MTTPTKTPPKSPPAEVQYTPMLRKFTVEEYYRLAEVGILHPDERVELIQGEIIVMAPIGPPHVWSVNRWNRIFAQPVVEGRVIVQIQNPILLGNNSEPEPDVALLSPQAENNPNVLATPEYILLVIEVSDSSLAYDRNVKAKLYAEANIPETWLMNLPDDCIEGFSEPTPDGYAQHTIYRRGDRIAPTALPDLEFAVEDLLPPVVEQPDNV